MNAQRIACAVLEAEQSFSARQFILDTPPFTKAFVIQRLLYRHNGAERSVIAYGREGRGRIVRGAGNSFVDHSYRTRLVPFYLGHAEEFIKCAEARDKTEFYTDDFDFEYALDYVDDAQSGRVV